MIRTLLLIVALVVMAGCVNQKTLAVKPVDPAFAELLAVAKDIRDINVKSAQIESARNDKAGRVTSYEFSYRGIPDIWSSEVALLDDFNGDIASFVEMLSAMTGLHPPRMVGNRPAHPVLVTISSGERKLMDFLADAGFQAGDKVLLKPVLNEKMVLMLFGDSIPK